MGWRSGSVQFVYFHGQPGGPAEARFLAAQPLSRADVYLPDRCRERPDLAMAPYFDVLATAVLDRYPAGPVRLIGFSMGAFVAIEVGFRLATRAPDRDIGLELVSAAAPLALGDFLPHMAGGAIFTLARDRPALFAMATRVQGLLARAAPGLLFSQLFATAAGADIDLARDPDFRAVIQTILKLTTASGARGYRREILAYVTQDPARLRGLNLPVRLWQGEADNWTPPAMAAALAAALPWVQEVRHLAGLSHYSALRAALPEIAADSP